MTASFDLDEELTITLVSGYDTVMRRNIVAAWKKAEAALTKPVALIPNFDDPIGAAKVGLRRNYQAFLKEKPVLTLKLCLH